MHVIVPGSREYLKFLPSTCREGVLLTSSRFILRSETVDGTLLCNTLTGELSILSDEERILFDKLPLQFTTDPGALEELIRHRFVVPVTCREDQSADQLRALLQKAHMAKQIIRKYNVLPTTCCNARCFYCFESDIRHITMSEETAERLVQYIASHHGSDPVKLSWFGGEPTLGRNRIDQICSRLKELGIDYHSDMVSNGYLFDEELVKHSRRLWNLKRMQITLDGTEEIYNRTKAYVGVSDNPFQRVMRNIRLLLEEGIYIDIRLNLDNHNAADLEDLVEELSVRFKDVKNLSVYVSRLNEDVGYSPICHCEDEKDHLNNTLIRLRDRLEECGWKQFQTTSLPKLRIYSCMADDSSVIQCLPDGILSKCEDFIYQHTVGTLVDGITDQNEIQWWRQRTSYEGCEDCPLYPSCVRLLMHCPVKKGKCLSDERERRIARYKEVMFAEYERWRKGNAVADLQTR